MDYLQAALQIANKLLDKIPDYDQRKKEKYHKLLKDYTIEKARPADMTDHDLILNMRDEIKNFLLVFSKEIEGE